MKSLTMHEIVQVPLDSFRHPLAKRVSSAIAWAVWGQGDQKLALMRKEFIEDGSKEYPDEGLVETSSARNKIESAVKDARMEVNLQKMLNNDTTEIEQELHQAERQRSDKLRKNSTEYTAVREVSEIEKFKSFSTNIVYLVAFSGLLLLLATLFGGGVIHSTPLVVNALIPIAAMLTSVVIFKKTPVSATILGLMTGLVFTGLHPIFIAIGLALLAGLLGTVGPAEKNDRKRRTPAMWTEYDYSTWVAGDPPVQDSIPPYQLRTGNAVNHLPDELMQALQLCGVQRSKILSGKSMFAATWALDIWAGATNSTRVLGASRFGTWSVNAVGRATALAVDGTPVRELNQIGLPDHTQQPDWIHHYVKTMCEYAETCDYDVSAVIAQVLQVVTPHPGETIPARVAIRLNAYMQELSLAQVRYQNITG